MPVGIMGKRETGNGKRAMSYAPAAASQEYIRIPGDALDRTHLPCQCALHRVGRRANIGGALELPQHRGQPLGKLRRNAVEQKRFCTKRQSPPLPRAQQRSVEYGRSCRHLLAS